jgi:hypothetical protein
MKNKIFIILLTFFALILADYALAGTATVSWNANTETDLAGYKIYYGTSARSGACPTGGYPNVQSVGKVTSYTFSNLTDGATYYFSVTALDTSNNESTCSSEVSKVIPSATNYAPIGNFDGADAIHATGWAFDQNAGTSPINVHIYIDGVPTANIVANLSRTDIIGAGSGVVQDAYHGFDYAFSGLSAGNHTIQVYAINTPTGTNPELPGSPKTITITTYKTADLNQDSKVNSVDFGIMMSFWASAAKPKADINQDAIVNSVDFGVLMSQWTG